MVRGGGCRSFAHTLRVACSCAERASTVFGVWGTKSVLDLEWAAMSFSVSKNWFISSSCRTWANNGLFRPVMAECHNGNYLNFPNKQRKLKVLFKDSKPRTRKKNSDHHTKKPAGEQIRYRQWDM